ncbi:MAG: amino acid permease [Candidatus Hydrogenedentes bacterium]|nr:amino acid permease [Candidatus Hydrogenedentota bacterium]
MTQPETGLVKGVRLRSATGIVVASMIGAGIFTTTGFQAAALGHPGYIFALWIVGGILAFCGALCFAELGAAMPEAGAEYVYIRETYGAAFGFMTAFIALFAGFSAPIGAALKGLVAYLGHFAPVLQDNPSILGVVSLGDLVAIAIGWGLVLIHVRGIKFGLGFNDLVTFLKIAGIVAIILGAFAFGSGDAAHLTTVAPIYGELGFADKMSAFATSLIFVTFCYLGWNGSAYLAAEMNDPQRDLPRSLLIGTALVTLLYLGLNAVYFYGAGVEGLAGKVEVGLVAAQELFGDSGATIVTLVLCVSILASASAMTAIGPRVYYAFGGDFPQLRALATTNRKTGAPTTALYLQGIVTTIIILSGRIDQILQYTGLTLTLFSSLAVSCVIVLRIRRPEMTRPFKTWGYPFTPLLYLSVSLWTMIWAVRGRPVESMLSLATVVAGGIAFYVLSRRSRANNP